MTKRPTPAKKSVVIKKSTTTTKTTQLPVRPKESIRKTVKPLTKKEEAPPVTQAPATPAAASVPSNSGAPPVKTSTLNRPAFNWYEWLVENHKKILIPILGICVVALVTISCARLPGCKSYLAGKARQINTTTNATPSVQPEEKPIGEELSKSTPPVTAPTNSLIGKVLSGLRSVVKTEVPSTLSYEGKGISVTNAVPGATTTVNVNGGTVNGGINVYNGTIYQGVSSGEKTTVTPGDVTEDTFREVISGVPSITLEPGEIAYIDFRAGLKGFSFSFNESQSRDIRALYDGQPLNSKHDPENTQRVTIENTGFKLLKLFFSW